MHRFRIGRSARTGRFLPIRKAMQHPNTTTIETIRVPSVRRKRQRCKLCRQRLR